MRARTLVIMAVGLMAPSIAHADWTVAYALHLCNRVGNCEWTLAIAAQTQSNRMRPNNPEPDRACIPDMVTDRVLHDFLMDYFNKHPERNYEPFHAVVKEVTFEKWPCDPLPTPQPLPPPTPRTPGPTTFEELGCRKGVCGAVRPDGTIDPRP